MGGINLTPVCYFTVSALLEVVFPKAHGLGWGSISLFHAVVSSAQEERGALMLGEVVSFPSPGFRVGWSKVTPAVNIPCSSQWAITLKDQFSSFACNIVFLLHSLGMKGSKSHHVNYTAVATAAWTMWSDCPVTVSLLPKCSIMAICTQGSSGIRSDLSVWPYMAKDAAASHVVGQKEARWQCGFRELVVRFYIRSAASGVSFVWVHISQNNWGFYLNKTLESFYFLGHLYLRCHMWLCLVNKFSCLVTSSVWAIWT